MLKLNADKNASKRHSWRLYLKIIILYKNIPVPKWLDNFLYDFFSFWKFLSSLGFVFFIFFFVFYYSHVLIYNKWIYNWAYPKMSFAETDRQIWVAARQAPDEPNTKIRQFILKKKHERVHIKQYRIRLRKLIHT